MTHSGFFFLVDWLEKVLNSGDPEQIPKVVSIVNPGNPSGTYVPEPLLKVLLHSFIVQSLGFGR
jgi:histidinol-phosphate/aromatic aminotransferase/cobyric acid decarboxylase-like protein